MAFPDDVLTENERVVLHLRPHWKTGVRPVGVLVVAVVGVLLAWWLLPDGDGGAIATALFAAVLLGFALVRGVWPLLVWRATHYLLTDERVLLQHGVFSRERRDIPLARVNDHAMSQRFVERLLGCGTLTVESAGERGQAVLTAVPGVERVQTTLYELVEADRDRSVVDDEPADGIAAPPRSAAPGGVAAQRRRELPRGHSTG